MAFYNSQGLTQGMFSKSAGYITPGQFWASPVAPPPDPNLITNFIATPLPGGQVQLNWTAPTNPDSVVYGTSSSPSTYYQYVTATSLIYNVSIFYDPGTSITFYVYPTFNNSYVGPTVESNTVVTLP
jgi:hypothetical protein